MRHVWGLRQVQHSAAACKGAVAAAGAAVGAAAGAEAAAMAMAMAGVVAERVTDMVMTIIGAHTLTGPAAVMGDMTAVTATAQPQLLRLLVKGEQATLKMLLLLSYTAASSLQPRMSVNN